MLFEELLTGHGRNAGRRRREIRRGRRSEQFAQDRLQRVGPDLVPFIVGCSLSRSFIMPSTSLPSLSASRSLTLRKRIVLAVGELGEVPG